MAEAAQLRMAPHRLVMQVHIWQCPAQRRLQGRQIGAGLDPKSHVQRLRFRLDQKGPPQPVAEQTHNKVFHGRLKRNT
jgi:hypothetical protein